MCESYGDWGAIITKQIRPMDSVILPQGMTDLMLDDLREFMSNKVQGFARLTRCNSPDVSLLAMLGLVRCRRYPLETRCAAMGPSRYWKM